MLERPDTIFFQIIQIRNKEDIFLVAHIFPYCKVFVLIEVSIFKYLDLMVVFKVKVRHFQSVCHSNKEYVYFPCESVSVCQKDPRGM